MQTHLADFIRDTPDGRTADAILRKCVHCGFCTATCPTYQLLGDELDGPRGRIYLIKQLLEGAKVTERTRTHLDRCLTCRACETTCPSGVRYGRLADIGRRLVEERVPRPLTETPQAQGIARGHPPSRAIRTVARGGPSRASAASRSPRAQGAAARTGRPLARGTARAAGARARRLRAGRDCAGHRRGGGAGPRPARHQLHPDTGLRMLRGGEPSLERARRRTRDDAPQYRCVVAGDRGRSRSNRHHRERVRGRGQGVRGAPGARPGVRGQGGARFVAGTGSE